MDAQIHGDREVKRLLRQARSLSRWSIIGLNVPLAAWILGGIALGKVRSVYEDYLDDSKPLADKYATRASRIRSVARTMIILSLIVSVIFGVYSYTSIEASIQTQQAQKQGECMANTFLYYNEIKETGQTGGHSLAWYTSAACNDPITPPSK